MKFTPAQAILLIHRNLHDAVVIPQRATFEILAKRYAYVVGEDNVVHQREITIQTELPDIYVIESGLKEGDKNRSRRHPAGA